MGPGYRYCNPDANTLGEFRAGAECAHGRGDLAVGTVALVASPLGWFKHWSVRVTGNCRRCRVPSTYTLDFGPVGTDWRCGEYTKDVHILHSFVPNVAMTVEAVGTSYESIYAPSKNYSAMHYNCKDWANDMYVLLGGKCHASTIRAE